jgi:hypothetical protein
MNDENSEVYAKVNTGKGTEAKVAGGRGCLVVVWAGAVLVLAACAGWVVDIWRGALD